jgi:hypothetical protein
MSKRGVVSKRMDINREVLFGNKKETTGDSSLSIFWVLTSFRPTFSCTNGAHLLVYPSYP